MTRPEAEQWAPCDAGQLAALQQVVRQHHRRREFLATMSTGGIAVVTFSAVGLGGYVVLRQADRREGLDRGAIGCGRCVALMDGYLIDGLTEDELAAIERHLAWCNRCNEKLDARRERRERLG